MPTFNYFTNKIRSDYLANLYCSVFYFLLIDTSNSESLQTINIPYILRYYIKSTGSSTWTTLGTEKVYNNIHTAIVSNAYNFRIENNRAVFNGLPLGDYNIKIVLVQYNETSDTSKVLGNILKSTFVWNEGRKVARDLEIDNRIAAYTSSNTESTNSFQTTISIINEPLASITTFKTLKDIMNKIISMINPDYGTFSYNISDEYLNTPIPDLVFDGVKTLSEVLFQIGKVLKSVPVISEDNIISFITYSPEDNENFNLLTEKLNIEVDSNYYASGFISNLKNIINISNKGNTIYSYYPGRDAWTTGRADSEYSSVFNPDNNCIFLENSKKGIYAIKSIKVKNYSNSIEGYTEPVDGLDITDFCFEKKTFDALYKGCKDSGNNVIVTNTCQANCFYYEKGNKKIFLSGLSENEFVAIFGSSASATYQIQNAIAASILRDEGFDYADISGTSGTVRTYSTLKAPDKYKFQITYIDDFNSIVKTQQFDMSNFSEPFDIVFNQDTETISAYNFGVNAQEEISRRGNESIISKKNIYNISELPKLGEIKIFEDGIYLADEIEYTFYNNFVDCNINFTKDFNKINNLVQISREYRQYNISPEAKVDRNISAYDYSYLANDYFDNIQKPIVKYTSL